MHNTTYDRRIFSPGLLFRDLGFLISRVPALARARRNPEIGRAFMEKIMMVVTAVNGCTYCTWFHAQQAVTSGMSDKEISDMFDLQFEASASEHELPALLFAQHFAETNRNPDPDMVARLNAFYGTETARDIMLLIRMIFFGNLFGNTLDAFPARLKGKKAENSSVLFEFLFWLATFWMVFPAKWILRRRDPADTTPVSTGENP
ncbi:carboxymuconolactone decarboxylase family protein [Pseudooceanicola sp.]|uniref:carboxymuconolactone decarboxylase family protein n=1 Tax=Pseudooceanicola sp. TaxID=1914328 RepID=UPI002612B0B2|nr:carboxymuconolactone decarboxylase family protein [Pseudooceanicola sp.]MDF1856615.1 carboxymuconolactone decarboxylase family protein [Pseudooceanicola sp.]